MPAARGVKRTASKSSAAAAAAGPKNKKKRNVIQLEVPTAPKRRGRLMTCGQGDVGQLGLGEDVVETTKFKAVSALGDRIVDLCAGGMHTIALDRDGKVWTFGCNDEGALGRPTSGETDEGSAGRVTLPAKTVAVSAGDSHSAALTEAGDVYAWGAFRDSHGSMGLIISGRENKTCREPVKVDVGETAAAIASGGDHLVILTTSGAVYTMGCGEQGQLGRLPQRSATREARQGFAPLLVPGKVTLRGGASHVWAGYHATFALGMGGAVSAWGLNNYGQLGITGENRKTAIFSPTECDAFSAVDGAEWRCVSPGQHHSLALDAQGVVYAVGRCEYGRLGLGDRPGDAEALEPIPVLQDKKCVSIAAGTSSSFAVTDTGTLFAWGMGSEGQLGGGHCNDLSAPAAAALPAPAAAASAGGQHTVVLVEDPNAARSPSPAPEKETVPETIEDKEDEQPEPEKKPKGRPNKRQKKQEQEEEISSTSSAAPQKVNGDEKLETPMEVDETDNTTTTTQEKKEGADKEENKDQATEDKKTEDKKDTDTAKPEDDKIETDSSSQDTADTEKPEPTTNDVEMTEAKKDIASKDTVEEKKDTEANKPEVNGTQEVAIVEKKVDSIEASESVPSNA